ncbi:MAG TPA: PAS domain S-box protein [Phycisphaerae bacterium]|nr:PAS domain S-box protein [Phycisphaerae bacterium]
MSNGYHSEHNLASPGQAGECDSSSSPEEQLRKSEERFLTLVSNIPGAVFRTANDSNYTLAYISDGIKAITGYSAEELMRLRAYSAIIHPDDRDHVRRTIDGQIARQRSYAVEYRIIDRQGRARWIYEQGQAVPTDDGRDSHLDGVIVDIHRLKETERELRESEERFRTAFQMSPVCQIITKLDGTYVDVNDGFTVLTGYSREEAVGGKATTQDIWADPDRRRSFSEELEQRGQLSNWEIAIRRKDGTIRSVLVSARIIRLHGEPRILTAARDVTEWREAQEALRESEQRFRGLFESMSDGVILCRMIYDETGRAINYTPINMNPAAERMFNLDCRAAVGQPVTALLQVAEPPYLDQLAPVAETGEPAFFTASSTNLNRTFRVTAFCPARGQFAALLEDITDQVRAEAEKARLQEQLHQAQKMEAVGQLAGGMAHDFNNLLTIVLGHLQLAQSMIEPDHPAQEALAAIERAAAQGAEATRSLLTFSRKYQGRMKPVDLAELVRQTTALLDRMLPNSIELRLEPFATEPVWVQADATQMQQVLINLALNARDAMPEGGFLQISLTPDDSSPGNGEPGHHFARLTVRDSGSGMPPDIATRVFEPFFTTKPRGQGTGLGLAIVHGIVQCHGGRIDLTSTPGTGTTLTIQLPRTEPPVASNPHHPQSETPGHNLRGTVLLAEDNEAIRRLICRSLEGEGMTVLETGDGASLLDLYQQHAQRIGLLILDIDLPRMSGLACLRKIREAGGSTPALIITGSAATELDQQTFSATHLLRKPFRVPELHAAIAQILSGAPH